MQSRSPLARQIAAWQKGIESELSFWNRWFDTKGLDWPSDFLDRAKADREMAPWMLQGLDLSQIPRVLDVGAGPMTKLGTRHNGGTIDLTASDPLAPVYAELAEKYGVRRPVPTVQAFAEDLSCYFDIESFDLVFCSNALDHSFDPVRGLEEMYKVARPKGRILLVHRANEAEFEKYEGFHQWNLDKEGDRFIIWNKEVRTDVNTQFCDRADIVVEKVGDGLTVMLNKKGLPIVWEPRAAQGRVRALLAAQLDAQLSF